MRYLRKYESIVKEIDSDYIKLIFIDFFDKDKKCKIVDTNKYTVGVLIPEIRYHMHDYSIEDRIKEANKLIDFLQDIEVCIKRVLLEYPDLKYIIFNHGGFDPIGGRELPIEYEIYFYYPDSAIK
jgi:hypothetical protein